MSHPNVQLIIRFYEAFQKLDAESMAACYANDVVFSDPVFGELRGEAARDMWRMLTQRAKDFSLTFKDIEADERSGSAQCVAQYEFSQSGRRVVNHMRAEFTFRDGVMVEHNDQFDLWRWAQQALGLKGMLLGGTPFVQKAIRGQATKGLALYRSKRLSQSTENLK